MVRLSPSTKILIGVVLVFASYHLGIRFVLFIGIIALCLRISVIVSRRFNSDIRRPRRPINIPSYLSNEEPLTKPPISKPQPYQYTPPKVVQSHVRPSKRAPIVASNQPQPIDSSIVPLKQSTKPSSSQNTSPQNHAHSIPNNNPAPVLPTPILQPTAIDAIFLAMTNKSRGVKRSREDDAEFESVKRRKLDSIIEAKKKIVDNSDKIRANLIEKLKLLAFRSRTTAELEKKKIPYRPNADKACAVCTKYGCNMKLLGKVWHDSCLKCSVCEVQLIKEYASYKDELPLCITCGVKVVSEICEACPKVLKVYHTIDNKKYCPECYDLIHAAQCVICLKYPKGFLKSRFWNTSICEEHGTVQSCCSCGRTRSALAGYVDFPDSRCTCTDCGESAILSNESAQALFEKVCQFWALKRFTLSQHVPVYIVSESQMQLHGTEEKKHTGNIAGLTRFTATTNVINEQITRNVQAIKAAALLSHEFMHAWMALQPNVNKSMPNYVEEGLCELAYAIFLREASANATKDWDFALIEYLCWNQINNEDPVYGVGLRKAIQAFEKWHKSNPGRTEIDFFTEVCSQGKFN